MPAAPIPVKSKKNSYIVINDTEMTSPVRKVLQIIILALAALVYELQFGSGSRHFGSNNLDGHNNPGKVGFTGIFFA